jgi:RNA polymerase sigma-70 factor (ECF subfamily)
MSVRSSSNAAAVVAPPGVPDFRALYDSEFGYIWNSLRRLGVPEKDLEDLAHDTFMTAHRRLSTYDPARPIRPWLFGIAFRLASDFRRQARHQYELSSSEEEGNDDRPDDARLPDELAEASQARRQVLEALETLDIDRRAVFVMYELDGHPVPEIASALGIPLNTAYSRLRLARQDFAASVRRLQAKRGGR